MYKDLKELPDNSKLWIFQADRIISESEKIKLELGLKDFCHNWTSHDKPLETSFAVMHNLFILLCANDAENPIGGCSIDTSVKAIKTLQSQNNLDFFRRDLVAIIEDKQIGLYPTTEIKNRIMNETISDEALVFNNAIRHKDDIDTNWIKPIKESWMAKYFANQMYS